jgi:hypothetical protein
VPTDWGPVVQTGIGAAAAIGGGFVGAWWQARAQERAERQRQRERAAELGVATLRFFMDSEPSVLARLDSSDALKETAQELLAQFERLQTELWILATWYPSNQVRGLGMDLPGMLSQRLGSALLYAHARLQPDKELAEAALAAAEAQGTKTRQALADLLAAIQGA